MCISVSCSVLGVITMYSSSLFASASKVRLLACITYNFTK